ncbi:uncharacterized protein VICG_01066 [Vittaforma corneae ATCC 50505]|uniref:glycine hydroxymethyltransferase n=1 Tax=Vittaforma corneae (strain ATCC 50505) TaxID=993615 RepID=L2GNI6_VITCO|nr:uncharacterized protein VICG_01066 [Vittaforma corneae ATCC 50505]ELA41882.1 hypothetical protein VICG_01066 [Vittaforma corneae ATCC 50505]
MMIYERLENFDPEIDSLIKAEEERQRQGLELIASENFASVSVLQANASVLTNKYSEGQVGQRYYGGNEYIDAIETICKTRALEVFNLDPNVWDVNVQTLSGTAANIAVYTALVGKDGKIMGLDLPSGGHLSHGYQTQKKKISASSIFFNSRLYKNGGDGQIDYEKLEKDASEFKPDLIICGGSAYPCDFDYRRFREIAKDAYLMMDMAHISGLIAAGLMNNPFEYCDVVTTTTHKILRGPRSAMIFYKKKALKNGTEVDIKSLIDFAVFPGLQGGPHNQKIAALAVALKQANTEEYRTYVKNVYENAQTMSDQFKKMGYRLYSGGTMSHLILVCLEKVGGYEVEKVCEMANIYLNKNCIATDTSPLRPSGIRLGTPALTTRGLCKEDIVRVCLLVDEAIKLSTELSLSSRDSETGKLDTETFLQKAEKDSRIADLKRRVVDFIVKFDIPRFNYRQ